MKEIEVMKQVAVANGYHKSTVEEILQKAEERK
jgi:hypothetical protein